MQSLAETDSSYEVLIACNILYIRKRKWKIVRIFIIRFCVVLVSRLPFQVQSPQASNINPRSFETENCQNIS